MGAPALAWIRDHLPVGRPAVVLHGDLLPQNVLVHPISQRLAVVDWEYARIGDPAYDLAIVTRGDRKLLGVDGGLRRLVEAYCVAGGALDLSDVTVWEMLLVLKWLDDALRCERVGLQRGYPPRTYRMQIRKILNRARA